MQKAENSMIHLAFAAVLIIALITTVFLFVFTLTRCQSAKKVYFVITICAVFMYVLGYLLEILAGSADGAYTATRVTYLGSAIVAPVFLLFTADYCEYPIQRPRYMIPLITIPSIVIALLWTTNLHGLSYASYTYDATGAVPHMIIQRGSLYYLNHIQSMICMVISAVLMIRRLFTWDRKLRRPLYLLSCGVLFPIAANIMLVYNLNFWGIDYTPLSMVAVVVVFYIGIMRYDMFDFLPRANEAALRNIKEALVLVGYDMSFLSANPAAYTIFAGLDTLKKGRDVTTLPSWPIELAYLDANTDSFDTQFMLPGDSVSHYNASVNAVTGNGYIQSWVILIQDVTHIVGLMNRLESAAYTDGLTGIYNRRHFLEVAQKQLARANRLERSCYIILFDLDYFKQVNDTHGHAGGDVVLKAITQRIANSLRTYDLFARFGGEEFIIMVTETDETIVMGLAERLRLIMAQNPCRYGDAEIPVTASFGVATGTVLDIMIQHADKAMYQAKDNGRNCVMLYKP